MTHQTQTDLRFWSSRKNLPLARSTAQDPGAAPATLALLAQLTDQEVLRSLTKNPSTPTKALLTLAERFTREFIENPILPLLLLENPYAVFGWATSLQEKLLLCDSLPAELFGLIISRDAEKFCLLAADPRAPAPLLELLAFHTGARRSLLLRHQNATPKTIAIVVTSASTRYHPETHRRLGEYRLLLQRAGLWGEPMTPSPTLSTDELAALSGLGERARAFVAAHPECPVELLLRLLDDKASAVCHRAALHPKMPKEQLPELISRFDEIAGLLAMDARLSAKQLTEIFANEDKFKTATGIAKNPNTPTELLRTLLWHEHRPAREAAAKHPSTPQGELAQLHRLGASIEMTLDGLPDPTIPAEELEALSTHPGPFLLMLVAKHPNTPIEVLRRLPTKSEELRGALLRNPSILPRLAQLFEGNLPLALTASKKKNLPAEIYEHLCEHPAAQVRQQLAAWNPTLPYSLLERLTQDLDPKASAAAQKQLLRRQAALEAANTNHHKKRRHPRPETSSAFDDE